jgi:hypothetical protein
MNWAGEIRSTFARLGKQVEDSVVVEMTAPRRQSECA